MGLDMYAARRHYVKQWDHQQPEERYSVTVTRGGKPVAGIRPECISVIEEESMYWRKASHIHQWFVDNVQNGKDDCGTYYVSEDKLRELLTACKRVLEKFELVEEEIREVAVYDKEHHDGLALREPRTVLKDNAVVTRLLPRQPGFFFGSEEYNGAYLQDIQETRDWLVRILAESEGGARASIYYSSSW